MYCGHKYFCIPLTPHQQYLTNVVTFLSILTKPHGTAKLQATIFITRIEFNRLPWNYNTEYSAVYMCYSCLCMWRRRNVCHLWCLFRSRASARHYVPVKFKTQINFNQVLLLLCVAARVQNSERTELWKDNYSSASCALDGTQWIKLEFDKMANSQIMKILTSKKVR